MHVATCRFISDSFLSGSLDLEDDDSGDSMYLKPAKKKKPTAAQTDESDFFDDLPKAGSSDATKKPAVRKISSSMKPKSPPKKTVPVKKAIDSDLESNNGAISNVPLRAPPKRAARAVAKKYVEIISDDGDGGDSMFVDDD